MTVKEAIMNLLTYPMDAEIEMYCTHEKKVEKATIAANEKYVLYGGGTTKDKDCVFYPNQSMYHLNPNIFCTS